MKRMKRGRECCFALLFLLLTAVLVNFVSDVLRPAQTTYGSTWSAFRAEPRDSLDVIYLGSSFAYCDVNPSVVYDASGLTGYVMAGSEQPLSITYWYLKEIFRTQSPAAVVLEGTSLYFKQYQNYTQQNVSQMPFSLNKLGAIFTASEPEVRGGLLFDLSLYHSRWREAGADDWKKALRPLRRDHYKGHTPMEGERRAWSWSRWRATALCRRRTGPPIWSGWAGSWTYAGSTASSLSWPFSPAIPAVRRSSMPAMRRIS